MTNPNRSFYAWLMTQRNTVAANEVQQLANNAFLDASFPKQSMDFEVLSDYLEKSASYVPSMTVFDQAWEAYQADR
ncbi:YozE family protein [Leuconostocaceae bacterium ESL0958]|nr:YozE family protein [Leuconostocaceae bacterium ESL0958]